MPDPVDDKDQHALEARATEGDEAAAEDEAANRPHGAAARAGEAGVDWEKLGNWRLEDAEKLLRQGFGHPGKARLLAAIQALERAAESFDRAARNHRAVGQGLEADDAQQSARRCRHLAAVLLERRASVLLEQGEFEACEEAYRRAADDFAAAGDPVGAERAREELERVYFIEFERPRR